MDVVEQRSTRGIAWVCALLVGSLLWGGGSALAATPPEAPETTPASAVSNTTATLEGVLNPHAPGVAGWYFLYAPGAVCAGGSSTALRAEVEAQAQQVRAPVGGLAPNSHYTFCLVARNEAEEVTVGPPQSFTTSAIAPAVEGQSFSEVGSSSARLIARIDTSGSAGSYKFEYGPSATYGSSTAPASLGASAEAAGASATLSNLQPDTIYHFRVTVSTVEGTAVGQDVLFSTLPIGLSGLPDGRGYEMVTPALNHDAEAYVPNTGEFTGGNEEDGIFTKLPFQAARSGDAVTYVAAPTVGGNGSQGNGYGNQYLATRSSAGTWTQEDIQPPGYLAAIYQAFSSELTVGIFNSHEYRSLPPLSPDAPPSVFNDLYERTTGSAGYHPLLQSTPPNRTLGYTFYTPNVPSNDEEPQLAYAGASADLSHALFEANDALTVGSTDGGEEQNNLYDSVAGQLYLVNVLPDGSSRANATFGAPPFELGPYDGPDFSHVISADGSRIFWTDLSTNDLYVREHDTGADAATVQLDASRVHGSGGGGRFWTASSDGSRVLFTDSADAQLTASTLPGSGENLYEYELSPVTGQPGVLTDLTVSPDAGVEGVVGASEDGEDVYFVASGQLAAGARPGQPNLYRRHGGVTRFIATLSLFGDLQPDLGNRTAEVTPSGNDVVFESNAGLAGSAGGGATEVYEYDAEGESLHCVSCGPSGESASIQGSGFLPMSHSTTYLPHWLSDDGSRVFFESIASLVAQDQNGQLDVYEWERNGAGSCQREAGCIYLLSGGASPTHSYLLDASATGNDVFMITRAQLTADDRNENYDVYDARVGAAQPPAPPTCSGAGCQGVPPAPPSFATPASVTFEGVGNLSPPNKASIKVHKRQLKTKAKQCKRGYAKKHGRCVRKAKRTKASAKGRK